eukprot:5378685-Lingulodinium_polyedra.AAC.1
MGARVLVEVDGVAKVLPADPEASAACTTLLVDALPHRWQPHTDIPSRLGAKHIWEISTGPAGT